jgi:hypothetical protein
MIAQQPGGEKTVSGKASAATFDTRAAEYRHTERLRAVRAIATQRGKHG